MKLNNVFIGVDFDGTVVEHEWPRIGPDIPNAVKTLKDLVKLGANLILFTMRSDKSGTLKPAVKWFKDRDIPLFAINENPKQSSWSNSPKAYCHVYIDDCAIGCPLIYQKGKRPYVDWNKVAKLFDEFFFEPTELI